MVDVLFLFFSVILYFYLVVLYVCMLFSYDHIDI